MGNIIRSVYIIAVFIFFAVGNVAFSSLGFFKYLIAAVCLIAAAWFGGTSLTEDIRAYRDYRTRKAAAVHFDEWTRFYKEVFGLTVDLSDTRLLSPKTKGFGWLVVIAKELGKQPLNTAIAACRKFFPVHSYTNDLDSDFPVLKNNRDPRFISSYAIRVRDNVEADEENRNLSTNDIKSRKMAAMTLLERIVLEMFYFWKTGQHLDIHNITLCSGSHNSENGVPWCLWDEEDFGIFWYDQNFHYINFCARSVILA